MGLPELISQSIISKQPVQLTTQTTLPKKILEKILKDINTQVLETKCNQFGTTIEDCAKHKKIHFKID